MKRWQFADSPDARQIEEIASVLIGDGVVLMPTDTIYGLHARLDSPAIARIVALKGRDGNKPFVTIAASVAQLERARVIVPRSLVDLWPAPLTAILHRDHSTFAARVPDLAWLRAILERTGPLISTSANRAGEQPITLPNQLSSELQNSMDGVADGGTREGKPSSIVDFTGHEPRVIREGDPRFTQKLWKRLRKKL